MMWSRTPRWNTNRAHLSLAPLLLIAALSSACSDPIVPPPPPPEPEPNLGIFDALMSNFMDEHEIGAGVLGIMRGGEIIYQQGFGSRDSLGTVSLPDDAMFRLASVSKPFTAAAIRRLVQEGHLALDDRVFDLTGDGDGVLAVAPFPDLGDPRLADITIEHLLQHRGGWDRGVAGDLSYMEVEIADAIGVAPPPGRLNSVRYILGQPLQFAPGARSEYSNIGYLLLGLVIEEVTGEDYMTYLRSAILDPLGVPEKDLIQGRTFPEDRDPREPWYDDNTPVTNVFDPEGPLVRRPDGGWDHEARIAQGGLVASANAVLLFLDEYQTAGDDIGTPRSGGEGQGWRWNHTGSQPGVEALARQRGDGINYVVLFNKRSGSDSYVAEMRTEIDRLIDQGSVRWP